MIATNRAGRSSAGAVKRKQAKASAEPPAHYAVHSVTDEHEQTWHYPVRVGDAPGHPSAGEPCALVYYMAAELRTKTGRLKRPAAAVRFKSRARAVQFLREAAKAERELLRELQTTLG